MIDLDFSSSTPPCKDDKGFKKKKKGQNAGKGGGAFKEMTLTVRN